MRSKLNHTKGQRVTEGHNHEWNHVKSVTVDTAYRQGPKQAVEVGGGGEAERWAWKASDT